MKFVIKTVLAHILLSIIVLFIFQLILKFVLGSDSFLSLKMVAVIMIASTTVTTLFTIFSTRKRYQYITSADHSKSTLSETSIAYFPPIDINPFKFQENLKKYFHLTVVDHENRTYKFHEKFDYFQLSSRFGYYLKPHAYTDQFYLEIIPYSPRLFSEKKIKKKKELVEKLLEIST
ncbi:hypothetical protein [Psychroflexus halocasei]|uniref:Uncharacterized protein n=1 Tax=Psychroflexus halocasei TaxID=908615 RepID=A0A1H3ZV78_9FLAO|nr:hypothetical protein [Psychroflexus halocasei]SEA27182.1 hypothetical protein SAMN05421540_104209 [Psychroflexus halocasei]